MTNWTEECIEKEIEYLKSLKGKWVDLK